MATARRMEMQAAKKLMRRGNNGARPSTAPRGDK
jgi:hypothetical protein